MTDINEFIYNLNFCYNYLQENPGDENISQKVTADITSKINEYKQETLDGIRNGTLTAKEAVRCFEKIGDETPYSYAYSLGAKLASRFDAKNTVFGENVVEEIILPKDKDAGKARELFKKGIAKGNSDVACDAIIYASCDSSLSNDVFLKRLDMDSAIRETLGLGYIKASAWMNSEKMLKQGEKMLKNKENMQTAISQQARSVVNAYISNGFMSENLQEVAKWYNRIDDIGMKDELCDDLTSEDLPDDMLFRGCQLAIETQDPSYLSDRTEKNGAWFKLGTYYFKSEEYEKSIECFEKALQCDEHNYSALNNLMAAYGRLNNFKQAYETGEKYLQLYDDDSVAQAYPYFQNQAKRIKQCMLEHAIEAGAGVFSPEIYQSAYSQAEELVQDEQYDNRLWMATELAINYRYGVNVSKNYSKAYYFCRLAADAGHVPAQNLLAEFAKDGIRGNTVGDFAPKTAYTGSAYGSTNAYGSQKSIADELRDLKSLLDDGILTQEEFDEQKKAILSRNGT